MIKNKLSQSEIVGFAAIIVIVSVIGLIFLGFSIGRGDETKKTSAEISDFLQSSMYHTTNCTTSYIPDYKSIQDLIKSCYRNENCINLDKMACAELKEDFSKIVKESFQVSETAKNKAYKLNVYYEDLEIEGKEYIINFTEGKFNNCSSEAGASNEIFMDNGNLNVELDMCYG
jgi:hypothetical protein